MNGRRVASLAGVVALSLGLLLMEYPTGVRFAPGPVLASIVGVLALVEAARVVRERRRGELDEAETPDPERVVPTDAPGADLDAELEGFLETGSGHFYRARAREGLRSAAVAVLTRYGGCSESEARERLEGGAWTDDAYAAAFLAGEDLPRPYLPSWLRPFSRRESPLQRHVRHTVDEIASLAGAVSRADDETGRADGWRTSPGADAVDDASGGVFATPHDPRLDDADEVLVREPHATGHWRGTSAVALVGIGVGVLARRPAVLLAGVVGIGYAAYARSAVLPPGRVSVDRTLDAERPDPGDEVEVEVRVTNESDRPLADLRIVDGVPEALGVAEGSPRFGTALRPDESATFAYAVTARRGVHAFGPTLVVSRDLPAAVESERLLASETTLTCVPPLRPTAEPVPLREQAAQYAGRIETPSGGEGVEFYATREYRPGDSMGRVDWNRRARTGELTTVEFREERAAAVVVLVDARAAAYVSPEPHAAHAVDRAVEAAGALFTTLSESGNRVGLAALGSDSCWLAPGSGTGHRAEARDLLATHPALTPIPKEREDAPDQWRRQFRRRVSPGTQVAFLTPLCDDESSRLARRLDAYGYPVTVISPDPTAERTSGHRLARVARTLRLSALRDAGVPVVDWPWDASLDAALARYDERGAG